MKKNQRLTTNSYWDSVYGNGNSKELKYGKIKRYGKKIFGKKIFCYMLENYSEYLFWKICENRLPKQEGLKILEIGSAPGYRLIKFNKDFSYIPYGVEYSKEGVKLNRELFFLNELSPQNVIHSDFFSEKFQNEYNSYFDIIISMGFIEHFSNVEEVINCHYSLLKDEGLGIISIPNFRGFNYLFMYIFNRNLLKMHNMEIMDKKIFKKYLETENTSVLFMDYYGSFNLALFELNLENKLTKSIYIFINLLQLVFNLFFRVVGLNLENKYFSPFLMAVIKKH